jgi:hypothetical protein
MNRLCFPRQFVPLALLVVLPRLASTQVPVQTLLTPDATIAQPFNRITGFGELKDGRALVVDANDQTVSIVDFARGATIQVGRLGSGPGEYRFPNRLFRLGGDSIGIEDGGNRRILVFLAPTGFTGVLGPTGTAGTTATQAFTPKDSDGRGYLYSLAYSPFTPRQQQAQDSVPIIKWRVGSDQRDTAAFLPLPRSSSAGPGKGTVAFSTAPQWAVGRDGRIAIIRVDPYSVRVIDARGYPAIGPTISHQPIMVSEQLKRQWREEQARPVPVTMMTPNGNQSAGLRVWPLVEPVEFPQYLPPILDKATLFAPDGLLWIHRTVAAGTLELFDIVNERGMQVRQVRAPARTRLVGFGKDHVYLVRLDPDNQEFLERYRAPRPSSP